MRTSKPRAPRPGSEAEERAERRTRALEDPLDLRRVPDPRFVRLEVRNPIHQTRYDVLFPAFPDREGEFCTCADFARRSIGTCKHLEAAWIWLADHPVPDGERRSDPDARPTWTEVDRRLEEVDSVRLPRPSGPYPGSALLTTEP